MDDLLADVDAGAGGGGPATAVGFHGLWHYYATLLIHAGASVKTVQLALGHSRALHAATVTLNEYVHEWPDALDRTRSLVDAALGGRETAATPAGSRA